MALFRLPDGTEAKRQEAAPYDAQRPLTAAAARVHLNNKNETEAIRQRGAVSAAWQSASWQCYNLVGEVNYSFNYAASVLSRVRFHAAVVIQPNQAPVPVANAVSVRTDSSGSKDGTTNGIDPRLAQLAEKRMRQFSGRTGTAKMAKTFALNYQVAGECYLCCIDSKWSVRSTSEIHVDATGRAKIQPSASVSTLTPRYLRRGTPIGRIWNQHPQYSADPDSSLRAVLADCEELILLSRMMRVAARARLNAGLLFVPSEMTATARTVGDEADETAAELTDEDPQIVEDDDGFEKELYESMTAPVSDEDHAAAIVPLLVRGPAEQGDKIKHIQVSREVGTDLANRSSNVLNRVLQGINAPKELATGMSGSRYNNAQLIDDQSYKALVEPLALVFSDAVTEIYLRPMLEADVEVQEWAREDPAILDQVGRVVVWYDPSEVVTPVDQSQSATTGLEQHALSSASWRRANGFSDADAPTDRELAIRMVLQQVALPPDQISAFLRLAFPSVFDRARGASISSNGAGLPPDLAGMLDGRSPDVAPSPPVPATSVPADVS